MWRVRSLKRVVSRTAVRGARPASAAAGLLPGVLLAFAGAGAAAVLAATLTFVSALSCALLGGVALAAAGAVPAVARRGLAVAATHGVRLAVVLLGLRLTLADLHGLGMTTVLLVVGVVGCTFGGTLWLGRRLGLSDGLSLLTATGFSICGVSAISALKDLSGAKEEEVAYSIALVTIFGTLAIVVMPPVGHAMNLPAETYGAWAGASVHDVAQVVATASSGGVLALKVALVVKLVRVALLAPLVLGVATVRRRRCAVEDGRGRFVLPWFVPAFVLAAAVASSGVIPARHLAVVNQVDAVLLATGLFAVGASIDFGKLRRVGLRPLALGLLSWALIAVVSLIGLQVVGP